MSTTEINTIAQNLVESTTITATTADGIEADISSLDNINVSLHVPGKVVREVSALIDSLLTKQMEYELNKSKLEVALSSNQQALSYQVSNTNDFYLHGPTAILLFAAGSVYGCYSSLSEDSLVRQTTTKKIGKAIWRGTMYGCGAVGAYVMWNWVKYLAPVSAALYLVERS